MSSEPLAAPASHSREVSVATQEQCLVCTVNAEAAIYPPVLAAEVQKTRQLRQKAVLEEPVQQALQKAAHFPISTQSCCSPQYDQSLQGTHSPVPNNPPCISKTTAPHLVCTPPPYTDLCPGLANKPQVCCKSSHAWAGQGCQERTTSDRDGLGPPHLARCGRRSGLCTAHTAPCLRFSRSSRNCRA